MVERAKSEKYRMGQNEVLIGIWDVKSKNLITVLLITKHVWQLVEMWPYFMPIIPDKFEAKISIRGLTIVFICFWRHQSIPKLIWAHLVVFGIVLCAWMSRIVNISCIESISNSYQPGQGFELHACVWSVSPSHSSPRWAGAGLVQVLDRVWDPPPHAAEQLDQEP